MHQLRAEAAIPPARLKAKRYVNSALLIIDEVGFRPLDRLGANLFFRLVSTRYEKGSIILTSNKHVRDWPEIFAGDEVLTTAILDRLLHHVHILHTDGRSCRLRELDGLLQPQPAASPYPTKRGGEHTQAVPAGAQIWMSPDCGNLGVPLHPLANLAVDAVVVEDLEVLVATGLLGVGEHGVASISSTTPMRATTGHMAGVIKP